MEGKYISITESKSLSVGGSNQLVLLFNTSDKPKLVLDFTDSDDIYFTVSYVTDRTFETETRLLCMSSRFMMKICQLYHAGKYKEIDDLLGERLEHAFSQTYDCKSSGVSRYNPKLIQSNRLLGRKLLLDRDTQWRIAAGIEVDKVKSIIIEKFMANVTQD